jgi:hypothetical protein
MVEGAVLGLLPAKRLVVNLSVARPGFQIVQFHRSGEGQGDGFLLRWWGLL